MDGPLHGWKYLSQKVLHFTLSGIVVGLSSSFASSSVIAAVAVLFFTFYDFFY